jgi:hypothetical protein
MVLIECRGVESNRTSTYTRDAILLVYSSVVLFCSFLFSRSVPVRGLKPSGRRGRAMAFVISLTCVCKLFNTSSVPNLTVASHWLVALTPFLPLWV